MSKGSPHPSQMLSRSSDFLPYQMQRESQNLIGHRSLPLSCWGEAVSQVYSVGIWFSISLLKSFSFTRKSISSFLWSFQSTTCDTFTWSQCCSREKSVFGTKVSTRISIASNNATKGRLLPSWGSGYQSLPARHCGWGGDESCCCWQLKCVCWRAQGGRSPWWPIPLVPEPLQHPGQCSRHIAPQLLGWLPIPHKQSENSWWLLPPTKTPKTQSAIKGASNPKTPPPIW